MSCWLKSIFKMIFPIYFFTLFLLLQPLPFGPSPPLSSPPWSPIARQNVTLRQVPVETDPGSVPDGRQLLQPGQRQQPESPSGVRIFSQTGKFYGVCWFWVIFLDFWTEILLSSFNLDFQLPNPSLDRRISFFGFVVSKKYWQVCVFVCVFFFSLFFLSCATTFLAQLIRHTRALGFFQKIATMGRLFYQQYNDTTWTLKNVYDILSNEFTDTFTTTTPNVNSWCWWRGK